MAIAHGLRACGSSPGDRFLRNGLSIWRWERASGSWAISNSFLLWRQVGAVGRLYNCCSLPSASLDPLDSGCSVGFEIKAMDVSGNQHVRESVSQPGWLPPFPLRIPRRRSPRTLRSCCRILAVGQRKPPGSDHRNANPIKRITGTASSQHDYLGLRRGAILWDPPNGCKRRSMPQPWTVRWRSP